VDEEIDPDAPPQHQPQYQPPPPFAQPYPPPNYAQSPSPYPPAGYPPSPSPYPPSGNTPAPDQSGVHPAVRGGYAAALPGYPAPPPAGSNRKVWILVGCLLALIVAGIATLIAVGANGDDNTPAATHRVRVPESFAGYQRMESAQAKQVEQDMRDRLTTRGKYEAKVYKNAQLCIYAPPAQTSPSLYFVGVDAKSSGTVDDLLGANSPSHNVDSFLLGASVSNSTSYPAGTYGGSLKCGHDSDGQPLCVWVDRSTLGVVVGIDETITLPEMATATRQLRAAAEY
jgi:hypothetical protein